MIDNYLYRVDKDQAFLAGYGISIKTGNTHPLFLFPGLRIIRVLTGSAEWKIGSRIYFIKENDIVIVNNIEPRQFIHIYASTFVCEIFAFSLTVFDKESTCLSLFYNRTNKFTPVLNEKFVDIAEIHTLLDILKNKFYHVSDLQYPQILIPSLITTLVINILDAVKHTCPDSICNSTEITIPSVKIVVKSIIYINQNISQPFDVSILAKQANVSRGYFSKIFHKYTGYTPSYFISCCRIKNVIYLLNNQQMNILDAAMASGFNTSSGFYKAFHSIYGVSPKELLSSRAAFSKDVS